MKRDETTDTNSQTTENLNPDIVRVYWLWGVQEDVQCCTSEEAVTAFTWKRKK